MPGKLANPSPIVPLSVAALTFVLAASAEAAPGSSAVVQNPWHEPNPQPVTVDLSPEARQAAVVAEPSADRPRFDDLDDYVRDVVESAPGGDPTANELPEGLAQVGGMIVPEPMLDGARMVPDAAASLAAQSDPAAGDPQEFCAYPDAVPPGVYDYDHRPGGETPRFHTVYMNYLGGVLQASGENSAENLSGIARSGHPYPVYGGGETKAIAVAQAVQADLEQWAVRVVYLERPPKVLPYTMVMMGGHYSDTTAGPSGGVAPLDCEDFGQRNVCYVFQNTSPTTAQANVASQEIGHTLGLGHTSASDSVMAAGYAPTQGGDLGFHDGCAPTIQVSGQSAACVGVNKCHCGVAEEQDDVATLFATFAPASVDMVEPTIAITTPADGAEFAEGEEILVEFDPWDDVGGYGWKLIVEDENGEVLIDEVDYDRALFFNLVKVPPGTYTLTALIQDHADHTATDSVTITVVGEMDGDTDSGGDTDGTGGTTEPETGFTGFETGDQDDTGDGGTDGDSAAEQVDDDSGCSCRQHERRPAWLALLALPLLLRRRRRDALSSM